MKIREVGMRREIIHNHNTISILVCCPPVFFACICFLQSWIETACNFEICSFLYYSELYMVFVTMFFLLKILFILL